MLLNKIFIVFNFSNYKLNNLKNYKTIFKLIQEKIDILVKYF
jgi:hypothetical protein